LAVVLARGKFHGIAHNKLTMITPANNPGNVHQVCDLSKPA
jgi:hypothetical protein